MKTAAPHAHRWKIATPDGRRELPGKCTICGAKDMFKAGEDEDDAPWKRMAKARTNGRAVNTRQQKARTP